MSDLSPSLRISAHCLSVTATSCCPDNAGHQLCLSVDTFANLLNSVRLSWPQGRQDRGCHGDLGRTRTTAIWRAATLFRGNSDDQGCARSGSLSFPRGAFHRCWSPELARVQRLRDELGAYTGLAVGSNRVASPRPALRADDESDEPEEGHRSEEPVANGLSDDERLLTLGTTSAGRSGGSE